MALDNQSAIDSVNQTYPLNPKQADHDLLRDIRSKIARFPLKIHWKWVQGHQDNGISFQHLSPLAQDNIIADEIAKTYCNIAIQQQLHVPNPCFPDEGWTIYLGNEKQNRIKINKIYEHITQYDSLHYWQNKLHYHDSTHIN